MDHESHSAQNHEAAQGWESPQIESADDLDAAWAAAEFAPNPEAMRHRIVTIAFNNKWEASLPGEARAWMQGRDATLGDSALDAVDDVPILPGTPGALLTGGGL